MTACHRGIALHCVIPKAFGERCFACNRAAESKIARQLDGHAPAASAAARG